MSEFSQTTDRTAQERIRQFPGVALEPLTLCGYFIFLTSR